MSLTWAVFEILGTVAFAFSGAAVGLTRGMDVFGIALLSVVTAVGGGILRDVLAGVYFRLLPCAGRMGLYLPS